MTPFICFVGLYLFVFYNSLTEQAGSHVENIAILFLDSWMFSFYKSNSLSLMTYSKYISSLSLAVAQMVILTFHGGFVNDEKYLFIPIVIYGRSLLSFDRLLIIFFMIGTNYLDFLSPYFRVSKRYAYLSLRYSVKDDKACISTMMATKQSPICKYHMYFFNWLLLFFYY